MGCPAALSCGHMLSFGNKWPVSPRQPELPPIIANQESAGTYEGIAFARRRAA
jgi:hypothetical protein